MIFAILSFIKTMLIRKEKDFRRIKWVFGQSFKAKQTEVSEWPQINWLAQKQNDGSISDFFVNILEVRQLYQVHWSLLQ